MGGEPRSPQEMVAAALFVSAGLLMTVLACAVFDETQGWPIFASVANAIVLGLYMLQMAGCGQGDALLGGASATGVCGSPLLRLWVNWMQSFAIISSFGIALIAAHMDDTPAASVWLCLAGSFCWYLALWWWWCTDKDAPAQPTAVKVLGAVLILGVLVSLIGAIAAGGDSGAPAPAPAPAPTPTPLAEVAGEEPPPPAPLPQAAAPPPAEVETAPSPPADADQAADAAAQQDDGTDAATDAGAAAVDPDGGGSDGAVAGGAVAGGVLVLVAGALGLSKGRNILIGRPSSTSSSYGGKEDGDGDQTANVRVFSITLTKARHMISPACVRLSRSEAQPARVMAQAERCGGC